LSQNYFSIRIFAVHKNRQRTVSSNAIGRMRCAFGQMRRWTKHLQMTSADDNNHSRL